MSVAPHPITIAKTSKLRPPRTYIVTYVTMHFKTLYDIKLKNPMCL